MADKPHPDAPGMPYYEKSRQQLKELLQKRKDLERQLLAREEAIVTKEMEYLESATSGNIITGFDNYIKGTSSAANARRKPGIVEANKLFSRSSISYVPLQTAFKEGSSAPVSGQATPVTSSTPAASAGASRATKKKKAAGAAVEDSETDTASDRKKARTSFGAVRK